MRRLYPTSSSRLSRIQHHHPRLCHPTRFFTTTMAENTATAPKPHPDFKSTEAARPDWDTTRRFRHTKTADPSWTYGQGRNRLPDGGASRPHVVLDPSARSPRANYKLLISAVTPRPIALVSTRSADGAALNLAPFSYFNVVNSDPPVFVLSFSSAVADAKDTLRSLLDARECVVNIVSETFVEAANATSVDAPYGRDEWPVSGLTPVDDCETVRCPRVKESVFSVEAKLEFVKEWDSEAKPGTKSGTTVFVRGTRFWIREDALDEDQTMVDQAVLRPMGRLGGITYARVLDSMELTRPQFENDLGGEEGYKKLSHDKALV